MHIACYVVSAYNIYQMHIACYVGNTYKKPRMHIACYRWWYNPIWDCRQGHCYYSSYPSRLCFPDILSICCNLIFLVSAECIAVQVFLQLLRSFAVLWLRLDSHLRLGPITCRYGYNTFLQLPNSYKIIKYRPLYHTVT